MPLIKYDYNSVDESQGSFYDGDEPTRGMYSAKVVSIEQEQSSRTGNPMLHVTFEITDGDYKGWRGHDYYVLTEEAAWKLKQFTDALGLTSPGKKKGQFNTDKAVDKKCRIRVIREMYEGNPRGKVRSVLPWKVDEDGDDGEQVPDDQQAAAVEEAEDTEEAVAAEEEAEAEEGAAAEEADVWTWSDLAPMSRDELKATIRDEQLEVKVFKSDDDAALRRKVAEALQVDVPAEGDEEEPF